MEEMGIEAVYPEKEGTEPRGPIAPKYPYLLRGLDIVRPNQVWGSDITYVKLERGFAYLMAILTGSVDMWSPGKCRRRLKQISALKHSRTHSELQHRISGIRIKACSSPVVIYGLRPSARRQNQYGRTGSLYGQHLHGTALADNQV